MKFEVVTEETIRLLVNRFYQKVRADEALGPIFINAIGESAEAWEPHLENMYAFWSSVMLASGRYHGNPMRKHRELPFFEPERFKRWLELFAETARELHTEEIAALYIEKSSRIAANLKLGIYQMGGKG